MNRLWVWGCGAAGCRAAGCRAVGVWACVGGEAPWPGKALTAMTCKSHDMATAFIYVCSVSYWLKCA